MHTLMLLAIIFIFVRYLIAAKTVIYNDRMAQVLANYDVCFSHSERSGIEYPPVDVIVPTYNDEKTIWTTLDSIKNQQYKGIIRIIVCNDCSVDATFDIVQRWIKRNNKEVQCIVTSTVMNTGRKLGAMKHIVEQDLLTSPYCVVMDGDCILDDHCIQALVNSIKTRPDIVGVSGRILMNKGSGSLVEKAQYYEHYLTYAVDKLKTGVIGHCEILSGAISLIRTEQLVEQTKRLDASILVEDAVMTARWLRNGYKTVYNANAVAFSVPQPTLKRLYLQRKRWAYSIFENIDDNNFVLKDSTYVRNAFIYKMIAANSIHLFALGSFVWSLATLNPTLFCIYLLVDVMLRLMTIVSCFLESRHVDHFILIKLKPTFASFVSALFIEYVAAIGFYHALWHYLIKKPQTWATR